MSTSNHKWLSLRQESLGWIQGCQMSSNKAMGCCGSLGRSDSLGPQVFRLSNGNVTPVLSLCFTQI